MPTRSAMIARASWEGKGVFKYWISRTFNSFAVVRLLRLSIGTDPGSRDTEYSTEWEASSSDWRAEVGGFELVCLRYFWVILWFDALDDGRRVMLVVTEAVVVVMSDAAWIKASIMNLIKLKVPIIR